MIQVPVSVVIPCYRCADIIQRAVESVARQTSSPAEVILVDDGSGDNTLATLRELQARYGMPWIKVIALDQNRGVSVARNRGWDSAAGDYVAFLDADDAWHPEKIAVQYGWMRDHPQVAVSGHRWLYLDPTDALPNPKPPDRIKTYEIIKDRLLVSNPFVTPSVMLKRSLAHRFDAQKRYCEDYFLWLQLSLDGQLIFLLDAELAYIFKRIGKTGASGNLLRMRYGDIMNYWQLWRSKRLDFFRAGMLIGYSTLKFIVLLLLGPKAHYAIKQAIESRWQ
jgi:glycosyltransferase involved in cell wall biosynthesis